MKEFLPFALFVPVLIISGCLAVSPEAIIASSPVVQNFLADYPNAEIKATFYSEAEAAQILDQIKADCEKETVTAKDYYKVTITDEDSGLAMTAWVDWERQLIECAAKKGSSGEKIESYDKEQMEGKTGKQEGKEYQYKCYEGHVYKFDMQGNKIEKHQYCDYGCEEGACKAMDETQYTKECYEGHVYLFDDEGNKIKKHQYCEHGCADAACVEEGDVHEEEASCEETDGGYDIYHKGVAEAGGQRLEDHCNDDGTLTEKYCDGNEIKAKSVSCPAAYICKDARCTVSYDCEDSDDGQNDGLNYYEKGMTKAIVKGEITQTEDDYCGTEGVEEGYLREYYCEGATFKSKLYKCEPGKVCEGGACIIESVTEHEYHCSDTDDSEMYTDGNNIYEKGTLYEYIDDFVNEKATYTDVCDGNWIKEYKCYEGRMDYGITTCPVGYRCHLGACRSFSCSDTDDSEDYQNGLNFVERGTVHITYTGTTTYQNELEDYCTGVGYDLLREYYCGDGDGSSILVECPDGCVNGACTGNVTDDYTFHCSDSDDSEEYTDGKNYFEKGTAYLTITEETTYQDTLSDYCTETGLLHEYYCGDNDILFELIGCEEGYTCYNGACA